MHDNRSKGGSGVDVVVVGCFALFEGLEDIADSAITGFDGVIIPVGVHDWPATTPEWTNQNGLIMDALTHNTCTRIAHCTYG